MSAKPAFAAGTTAIALAVAVAMAAPSLVLAQGLPTQGKVVAGSGSIGAPSGGALAINQNSHRMAIDWQQFNIGAGNTVRFHQPGADAVALNRVLGPDASQIMGQLQANGRVFLVNPNGVLFGQGAQVDVGGLVASTLNIGNADFMAGNYRFRADAFPAHDTAASAGSGQGPLPGPAQGRPAAVVNHGRITAADGGAVALLGGHVHNQGVIQARLGTVALVAGNAVTLDFAGDGLLNVQIDQAAKNALVDNGHLIQADGGQVLMTAHASDALLQTVVNNTGVVEARTLQNREGKIVLLGDFSGGTVKVDGKLDASAPGGGDGGFIDTSGAYVQVADGVQVTTYAPQGKTGTWLIDPTDFEIRSGSGGTPDPGSSWIGADTLSERLALTNIEIETADAGDQPGDIYVNAPVSWLSGNDLTLIAHNDINVNAEITASGVNAGSILLTGRNISVNANIIANGTEGGGQIGLMGSNIIVSADMKAIGSGGAIVMAACNTCDDGGVIEIDGAVLVDGLNGSINMMADRSIFIRDAVSAYGEGAGIQIAGDNVVIDSGGTLYADGRNSVIELTACGVCDDQAGNIDINGEVSVVGEDGVITMMADGDISVRGAISAHGEDAQIALFGQDISVQSEGSLHAEGDGAVIALAACGTAHCDILDVDNVINDIAPSGELIPALDLVMGGLVSLEGNVSIAGDNGIIAMSGRWISHGEDDGGSEMAIVGDLGTIALAGETIEVNSRLVIDGDSGVIALAACTADGCGDILVNDEVAITGDGGAIFMIADGGIHSTGKITIDGNQGLIALFGGEVNVSEESAIGISGEEGGLIALAACGDAGCTGLANDLEDMDYDPDDTEIPAAILASSGSLLVDGNVFIDSNFGSVLMVGGDLALGGNVSVHGDMGAIAMLANDLSTYGEVAISGEQGMISAFVAEDFISNGAFSVAGTDGGIFLNASNLLINNTVTVTGDGGGIEIGAGSCGCESEGFLAIGGDIAVYGEDGGIQLNSGGSLLLDANLTAAAVFIEANDDIGATEGSVITAEQLDARSAEGAIALGEGPHRVGMIQASARTGLGFANGIDLALGQALVTGTGGISISTTGQLALVEAFKPIGGAPLSAAGTVRTRGPGDIDLVAGQGFINTLGSDAIQADNGNWRIWSSAPGDSRLNGLAYDYKQYNAHYGSSNVVGQGDGVLYTLAPVVQIGLQGTTSKTYNGTDLAALLASNYVVTGGVQNGDHIIFSKPGHGRYADKNAGAGKTVTADGLRVLDAYEADSGVKVYGYQIGAASGDIGRIDKRAITVAANDQRKRLGQADPALTWRIIDGNLVFDDALSGTLMRDSGELPGNYAIRQGSLDAGGNYALEFVNGELIVSMVTVDDDLGDLAEAYRAAVFSAVNTPQGPMAFDRDTHGGLQPVSLYNIENNGLRMPEGI